MREIRIEKITLNIRAGEAGPKLDRGVKLLQKITNAKPIKSSITATAKPSLIICLSPDFK